MLYAQWHFFKCEITTIIVGNFETILSVNVTRWNGIEQRVSKIIYKDICTKVHELWGWGFVCPSVSLSLLRYAIFANAFSSYLKTHKGQVFHMIAPQGDANLSTSPKVTIFPPPVPYYFISDQCLKGDRSGTLFLRNSIVAMDL